MHISLMHLLQIAPLIIITTTTTTGHPPPLRNRYHPQHHLVRPRQILVKGRYKDVILRVRHLAPLRGSQKNPKPLHETPE